MGGAWALLDSLVLSAPATYPQFHAASGGLCSFSCAATSQPAPLSWEGYYPSLTTVSSSPFGTSHFTFKPNTEMLGGAWALLLVAQVGFEPTTH